MDKFFSDEKSRVDLLFNYYIDTISPMVKTVDMGTKEEAEVFVK